MLLEYNLLPRIWNLSSCSVFMTTHESLSLNVQFSARLFFWIFCKPLFVTMFQTIEDFIGISVSTKFQNKTPSCLFPNAQQIFLLYLPSDHLNQTTMSTSGWFKNSIELWIGDYLQTQCYAPCLQFITMYPELIYGMFFTNLL